jgi:hypothetical protein
VNERRSNVQRKAWRTPGERAFDRCFLPFAAFFILNIIAEFILWRLRAAYEPLAKAQAVANVLPPPWHFWLPFAFGLILAVLWIRALIGLVRVWHDPSSRVLRFSASVLLIPFGIATCRLLVTPFHLLS